MCPVGPANGRTHPTSRVSLTSATSTSHTEPAMPSFCRETKPEKLKAKEPMGICGNPMELPKRKKHRKPFGTTQSTFIAHSQIDSLLDR